MRLTRRDLIIKSHQHLFFLSNENNFIIGIFQYWYNVYSPTITYCIRVKTWWSHGRQWRLKSVQGPVSRNSRQLSGPGK